MSPAEPSSETRGWRRRALLLLPIAVALIAHGLGLWGELVADDIPDIVRHPVVNGEAPLYRVLNYNYMGAPLGDGANTIRPLATLSFALEWRVGGGRAALFHAFNLVWFIALVVVVGRVLGRLVPSPVAAVGAAVFASLAIHVDAVALTANRGEVCSLVFALLALGAALDRRAGRAAAFYLIALLFKESAFLLPLVALWWVVAEDGAAALRPSRRGWPLFGLAAVAIAFLVARATLLSLDISGSILPADNPLLGADGGTRLWMPFVLLGDYLALAIAPFDLAFDYTFSAVPVDADLGRLSGWIGVGFVVLAISLIITRFRRGDCASAPLRGLAIAAGGFAASYALFSNSVFLIVTLFAERLFLAPSFYLVLGVVVGAEMIRNRVALAERKRITALLAALAGVVIVYQSAGSVARTHECLTEPSLLAAQVRAQPDSVKGQLYRARALAQAGQFDAALWHFGVATAGRNRFPHRFRAPRLDDRPMNERVASLPALIAPDQDPVRFWAAFAAHAGREMGPGVAAAARRAADSATAAPHRRMPGASETEGR